MTFTLPPFRRFPVRCLVMSNAGPWRTLLPACLAGFWFLIALGVLSGGSVYAEWVPRGEDEQSGLTIYIDPDTISINGNQVMMWILHDFKTGQTNQAGDAFMSATVHREYDCAKERTRVLQIMKYEDQMGSGKVVSTRTVDEPEWASVAPLEPGTIAHALWTIACGKP